MESITRKKELNSTQWAIYELLKIYAVGKENAKHASWIIETLQLENYSERKIRHDIKAIRSSDVITRKIGSGAYGYYLAVDSSEEPHRYLLSQIKSRIQTAVNDGVPITMFYAILRDIDKRDEVENNQTRITFGKYEKDTIKTYSDDLKEG